MQLSPAILNEKWYPRDRPFSEFEARVDFLLFIGGPEPNLDDLYKRWNWSPEDASALIDTMIQENFVAKYDEDSNSNRKERAKEIIDLYNKIFDRKIHLSEARCRMINARIKEGKKMKPPIGKAQFQAVFEFKKKEWSGTEQEKYLTIETLCAASHFLPYLEAARAAYIKNTKKVKTETEGVYMPTPLFKR